MDDLHSINGKFTSHQEATLHISDIGFRRGFAAFDFLRIVKGKPLFLVDHLERFKNSAHLLGLESPLNQDDLQTHIVELIKRNNVTEAGLQLFLTGGNSVDGFTPSEPNLIIFTVPLPKHNPDYYQNGAKLISYKYQRDLPEVKSTNYLMAVSLGKKMKAAGAADVLYHTDTLLLETTRSNIFLVTKNNIIVTPANNILKGVTRKHVIEVARKSFKLEQRDIALNELYEAKEIFITSVTKGAMPIAAIDDHKVQNVVGEITQQITKLFTKHVEEYIAGA